MGPDRACGSPGCPPFSGWPWDLRWDGARHGPVSPSVGGRMHCDDLGSRKDLLVDDEDESDDIQHGKRREGKPYFPLLAGRPLLGDPAPNRRQPENDQRNADFNGLIDTLMENGITVPIRCAKGRESVEQQQVQDDHSPDNVCRRLQPFPVLPELPLRRSISRSQEREGQENYEESGHEEAMPGEPAEYTPGEVRRNSCCDRVRDAYNREHDAVPPPEGSDPPRSGQGDNRCNRHSYEEADLTPRS